MRYMIQYNFINDIHQNVAPNCQHLYYDMVKQMLTVVLITL